MKKKNGLQTCIGLMSMLILLVWFFAAVNNLHSKSDVEGIQQLEEALRRGAVACYAAEGVYPPTLEYLCQHYGIQIDKKRYQVFYEIFAENLMPEITVVGKNYE